MTVFDDRRRGRQWLVTMWPHDGNEERIVRVGTRGFTTKPSDSPANVTFLPILKGVVFERDILGDGEIAAGALTFALDAARRPWFEWYWADRKVETRLGLAGGAWGAHELVFEGVMGEPQSSGDTSKGFDLVVPIFGTARLVDALVTRTYLGGAGGFDGTAEMEGVPTPLGFGKQLNVTPLLVDPPNRRYLFNGGAANALTAAYNGGNAGVGVTVDAPNGRVTTSIPQDNRFTVDIEGDKTGGLYVDRVGAVMRRLLTPPYGPLAEASLDLDAFAALDAAVPYSIGLWLGTAQHNLRDLMARLCRTAGAWWDEDRQGRITVGLWNDPAGMEPELVLRESDLVARSLAPEQSFAPIAGATVLFQPNWTPMGRSELAGVVKDTEREQFLARAFREAPQDNPGAATLYPRAARSEPIETLFHDRAAAEWRAAQEIALRGVRRRLWSMEAVAEPYRLRAGQCVRLKHPDWSELAQGKNFLVARLSEQQLLDRVRLGLWG